ncbi:MAG: hypothetical protein PHY72_04075 [Candidatus Pacebacteria bacterium]|nr:hypothetical protein [Candidatus Paceibacterota bacterium]
MENKITIEFAHICENVIVANNGNLSIINIFNQINADIFPAVHPSLTVVIGATGEEGEYEVNIQIKKQGEEQPVATQLLPSKMKIPKLPAQSRLFVKFSPLAIKSAGNYEIIISIAGQIKKLFFEAKQIQK